MNMKRIELAAGFYAATGNDEEKALVAIFRPVWAAQQAAENEAAAALKESGWALPSTDELMGWYMTGQTVLSQAPAPVDADLLARTAGTIAAALIETKGVDDATSEALAGFDWAAYIAKTPLDLAGRDPGAYLEATAANAEGDPGAGGVPGAGDVPGAVPLILALALRAQLEPVAQATFSQIRKQLQDDAAHGVKPRTCPVCGGEASLAHIGPNEFHKVNARTLYCAQCGTSWDFERIRCTRCGTTNQQELHYKSIEGDETHRLHTCDACGGYTRSFFATDSNQRPFSAEVEDVVMANLDAVAADLGLGLGTSAEE